MEINKSRPADFLDEARLKNIRTQMQNRHDAEMRDIQHKNDQEILSTLESQKDQIEKLRSAYEVQISNEAEALEERLHRIRLANDEKVDTEKKRGEEEINKIKAANQQRIAEYRKNGEAQIDSLRKQLQQSADTLHEKAKKQARLNNKEIS